MQTTCCLLTGKNLPVLLDPTQDHMQNDSQPFSAHLYKTQCTAPYSRFPEKLFQWNNKKGILTGNSNHRHLWMQAELVADFGTTCTTGEKSTVRKKRQCRRGLIQNPQAFDKQQMKKLMQSTLRFILKNDQKLVWVFLKHNQLCQKPVPSALQTMSLTLLSRSDTSYIYS